MKLEMMDIEIKDTPLSGRAKNCLKFAGVEYVSTLPQLEAWELLRIPNMGRKSVEEVIEYLSSLEVTLKGQDKFYKRKQQLPWVVKLIEEAVAQEREACALTAEDFLTEPEPDWDGDFWNQAVERVAMAIRARGEA